MAKSTLKIKREAKPKTAIKRTYSLSPRAFGLLKSEAHKVSVAAPKVKGRRPKPNLSGLLDAMILERFTKTK